MYKGMTSQITDYLGNSWNQKSRVRITGTKILGRLSGVKSPAIDVPSF